MGVSCSQVCLLCPLDMIEFTWLQVLCRDILTKTSSATDVDVLGRTALHYASLNDNSSTIVQMLLKHVRDLHEVLVCKSVLQGLLATVKDNSGLTALHLAAAKGRKHVLNWSSVVCVIQAHSLC